MDFFLKNLREVFEAINKLIDKDLITVNTRRVRQCNDVKASDRSKINFIWRALGFLEQQEILGKIGSVKPKNYKIYVVETIDIDKFISRIPNVIKKKKLFNDCVQKIVLMDFYYYFNIFNIEYRDMEYRYFLILT